MGEINKMDLDCKELKSFRSLKFCSELSLKVASKLNSSEFKISRLKILNLEFPYFYVDSIN